MEIILKKTVEKLGVIGDVVSVSDGFARNYLLPKGLAEVSTPEKVSMIEKLKEKRKLEKEKEKEQVNVLLDKLSNTSCTITVKAGEEDKLFGAVTSSDIADALNEQGVDVSKKKIILEQPIKKLGIYNITVKLALEKTVDFKLWVVKE